MNKDEMLPIRFYIYIIFVRVLCFRYTKYVPEYIISYQLFKKSKNKPTSRGKKQKAIKLPAMRLGKKPELHPKNQVKLNC